MATLRAFIFSIDAFVAFALSLLAIYSLIFFSSIPSAHYVLLTQAHYLAKDALLSLSLTEATDGVSLLDNIVFMASGPLQKSEISKYLDTTIPEQFGYKIEVNDAGNWNELYNSANVPLTRRPTSAGRVSVSSYAVAFSLNSKPLSNADNQYGYKSCSGNEVPCTVPQVTNGNALYPSAGVKVVKITVYA